MALINSRPHLGNAFISGHTKELGTANLCANCEMQEGISHLNTEDTTTSPEKSWDSSQQTKENCGHPAVLCTHQRPPAGRRWSPLGVATAGEESLVASFVGGQ